VSLEGGSIIRPLFFEFPTDDNAFNTIDNSFMSGDAIYVIPTLDDSKNSFKGYLPKGKWVDIYTNERKVSTG
jgi:alpha-glucosidase